MISSLTLDKSPARAILLVFAAIAIQQSVVIKGGHLVAIWSHTFNKTKYSNENLDMDIYITDLNLRIALSKEKIIPKPNKYKYDKYYPNDSFV